VNCQFYDRHGGNGAGGKSSNGGQCRRHAPQLSPNTAKNYLIEGRLARPSAKRTGAASQGERPASQRVEHPACRCVARLDRFGGDGRFRVLIAELPAARGKLGGDAHLDRHRARRQRLTPRWLEARMASLPYW
jgi:hypothetical protein